MTHRDSIEPACSFLHQKRNVYIHSTLEWQRDDIEYAIACYADEMSPELFQESPWLSLADLQLVFFCSLEGKESKEQ